MDNFFCNSIIKKSESNQKFCSETNLNYRREYSKGKSFKCSEWNAKDTYNNDDFIQDWVIYNRALWVLNSSEPSIGDEPGVSDVWDLILDGVSDCEFREFENEIQWKYEDEKEWKTLIKFEFVTEEDFESWLDSEFNDPDSPSIPGISITIDSQLSETSSNPLSNKVITKELKNKVDYKEGYQLVKSSFVEHLSTLKNYDDSELKKALNEKASKDELAKKVNSDKVATINGQSILEGGNIEIKSGSEYDDSELRVEIAKKLEARVVSTTEEGSELPFLMKIEQNLTSQEKKIVRDNLGLDDYISAMIDNSIGDAIKGGY